MLQSVYKKEAGGFLRHDNENSETWMDTLRRPDNAVEIQALYHRALMAVQWLAGRAGDREVYEKACHKAQCIDAAFDSAFFSGGFYADRICAGVPVRVKAANALVPLFIGPGKRWKEVLKLVESEKFTCDRGVRTLADGEPGFEPGGYHTGSAWSLTTAWAAAAEFRAGRPDEGWKYMTKMMETMKTEALGCIGECWNSYSNAPAGCLLQLWGHAFIIRLVDEFMLGIEADAGTGEVKVSPQLPDGVNLVRRVRRLGKKMVVLSFERRENKINVSCSEPGIKLIKTLR
jgi:glycogen debranching enzyme